MATWQNILDGADGLADIYGKVKSFDEQPVETTAPQPNPDREPVMGGGFQGLSQYGLQSSVGVVGLLAFVYLLVKK